VNRVASVNTAVLVGRVLITLLIATLLAWGAALLSAEATIAWYMQHYGVAQRADLADDMGLGMLGLFVQISAVLLSFVAALVVLWRLSARAAIAAGLTQRSSGQAPGVR